MVHPLWDIPVGLAMDGTGDPMRSGNSHGISHGDFNIPRELPCPVVRYNASHGNSHARHNISHQTSHEKHDVSDRNCHGTCHGIHSTSRGIPWDIPYGILYSHGIPWDFPWSFPWEALWDPWNTGTTQEHGKARGKAHRIPWEAPWDVLCYITWGTL